jgi:hypothetical protein
MLEEGDVQYKSPMPRSFFKALVLPAARLEHPDCVPASVPVRLPIADQSCNSDILSKQLEMFAQLGVVAKKPDPKKIFDGAATPFKPKPRRKKR